DPEPMPSYANPWLHGQPPPETVTVAKNTPPPSTTTTAPPKTAKTQPPPPATSTQSWNLPHKGGAQPAAPLPPLPQPMSVQPNASSAMNLNETPARPSS